MSIEIPDVTIAGSGRYVIADLWNKKTGEKKRVFWAPDPDVGFHQDLAKMLGEEVGNDVEVNCYRGGGGRINFDPEQKKIIIGDWSMTYREDDKEETAQMLEKAYPDFAVLISGGRDGEINPPLTLMEYRKHVRRELEKRQHVIRMILGDDKD